MSWLLTSDWHLNPGDIMPPLTKKDFPNVTNIGLVGDIINVLPLGINSWKTTEGKTTIESIARLTELAPVYYVFGNHEGRLSWLKLLLKDYPEVQILRSIEVNVNGEKWRIEHGHRFSEWCLLRYVADDIVEWFTTNPLTLKLWYRFCVKMGWLPGQYLNSRAIRREKYERKIIAYWAFIMNAARSKEEGYIVGHSHTRATINPPFGKVIDLGARKIVLL